MPIQRTTPATITIGTALNSLASGSRAQTNEVTSSTSSNVTDIVASWAILIGTITASSSTRVDVYVWGTTDDSGYPGGSATNEVITGTAGSITLSANGSAALRLLKSTAAHTTNITMRDEASVVAALGFVPRRWGLVFDNQTGAALGSSGHTVEWVETFYN